MILLPIQIQHLLKLNLSIRVAHVCLQSIQIQHLLKLNLNNSVKKKGLHNSNTTFVKVKFNLISEGLLRKEFKYNIC